MLPRRCKSCRCYVAPQLERCPRCRKKAPAIAAKPTKEDRKAARAQRDEKVATLHAKHIHWIPSALTVKTHTDKLEELQQKLERADTAIKRNVIRSEIRLVKAILARATVPDGKKGWTSEIFRSRTRCVPVFVSSKGHRYVAADKDETADLIIIPRRKKDRPNRLKRFEKSRYARLAKQQQKDEVTNRKRSKAKKKHRLEKRRRKVQS